MTDLKELSRNLIEDAAGGEDVDVLIDKDFAEDFVEHEPVPGMDNTRETPRQMFTMLRSAFPDLRFRVQDVLQDGDKVVVRYAMAGTHKADFLGVPASGGEIDVNVIDILQFRDDKCIAHWGVTDTFAMMMQMGAVDLPG